MGFFDRLQHAWNAFNKSDESDTYASYPSSVSVTTVKPDRVRITGGKDRTIIASIYNRMAIDVASTAIEHVRLDEFGRYQSTINSPLNNCLTLEANKDQTARCFITDIVMSMFDEGCVAVVPVDTSIDPSKTGSYKIETMRTAKIISWAPDTIQVHIYNDRTGLYQDIVVDKKIAAIIENPFYAVMNEPNSTLKRLSRKLVLLDLIDEQASSSKLDLIVQLPYSIKSDTRKKIAEERRQDIANQLQGAKYGVAYIDSTEKITQLNRSLENNLLPQIKSLMETLYSQLGITPGIMDGTANEDTMNNYYARTVEPILSAIVDEFKRKFLTKTARSEGQSIIFKKDPFKLVSPSKLAEMADKFTRNEILSSNEVRQALSIPPSDDPAADELRNKNLNRSNAMPSYGIPQEEMQEEPPYEDVNI